MDGMDRAALRIIAVHGRGAIVTIQAMTDTLHDSIDEAKAQAEFEHEGSSAFWRATV